MAFILGCSPITWRRLAPVEEALRAIAEVGYVGAPVGYRDGQSAEEVAALYRSLGLRPAPDYLGAKYHDPAERTAILERARAYADWSAALGLTEVFVAGDVFAERMAVAGHEQANRADQLSDAGYRQMADTLNETGRICQERGVRACFHNHAGSYIETRDEFDRILALIDPSLVAIGLDTGHLAYAGGDVTDFVKTYAPHIAALHLKDIYPAALAEGRRTKSDYRTLGDNGLWAELGEGVVDFPTVFAELERTGYNGWAIVEIDQTTKPTPRASIKACYDYLLTLGLKGKPS